MDMITYLDQLKQKCQKNGVWLHAAFKASRVHMSTHSRATRGHTDLRLKTAIKISEAIDRLAAARTRTPPKTKKRKFSVVGNDTNRKG